MCVLYPKCVLKCVLTKENVVDFGKSTTFSTIGVTGFELYTILLLLENISVLRYIFFAVRTFLPLFSLRTRKSVYF